MFLHHKSKQLGFTLLELLVVIGIIAVLVGIGSVSFSTAQMKARNAKRKADLQTLRNALEEYYSICGYVYPTPDLTVSSSGWGLPQGISYSAFSQVVCPSPSVNILTETLKDPKSGDPYYCYGCTPIGYRICAYLEPDQSEFCLTNAQ